MTAKVVDASAVVALIFNELTLETVVARLRDATLHAPRLLGFEVANACVKKIRAYPAESEALSRAFASFFELAVAFEEIDLAGAIVFARHARLSLYDASYLWLAVAMGAELVTLDGKLSRAYEDLRRSPAG